MILEVTFLNGRFHATPWARHVNEAVPEWPPSPFRVLRALLDAWFRKFPGQIEEAVVESLLSKLATPPRYLLPPARASHTRSYLAQNKPDPSDKKLVFDGFVVTNRGAKLLMGWPGVTLAPVELDALRLLAESLNYLGRSESWVSMRVVDDHDVAWNCQPLEPGPAPAGRDVVQVACLASPVAFATLGLTTHEKKREVPLKWFTAVGWGSAEAIAGTMNRPPALDSVFYGRAADALDARPPPTRARSRRVVEAVRFAVDARVRAPITDAVRVGELVRRNLLGGLKAVAGAAHPSPTFTGRDERGEILKGHQHLSVLSLDQDGDGFIDAVLVSSPVPLTLEEQRAVDRLRPVPRRSGFPLVLTPVQTGTNAELHQSASEFRSVTPFAPFLHWKEKRDGDFGNWLGAQVTSDCRKRGLPEPTAIGRLERPRSSRRFRWLDFHRTRKGGSPQPAYGLTLRFAMPVAGPFSLGAFSHFGLGLFVAV